MKKGEFGKIVSLADQNGITNVHTWDVLSRLTEYTKSSGALVSFEYRADGMRTRKRGLGTGEWETLYLHDGQTCVEEASYVDGPTRGQYTEVVRNGLGPLR